MDSIIAKCASAFIVGGDKSGNYNNWVKDCFKEIFGSVNVRETGYKNTFAITGTRRINHGV
jgi:hypothetical protein